MNPLFIKSKSSWGGILAFAKTPVIILYKHSILIFGRRTARN